MVHLDLIPMTKKLSVLHIFFSFLILLSILGHLAQGQATNDLDGKLNVVILTDRPQITPDESLVLLVQVTNVGEVDVKDIYMNLALPVGFKSNQESSISIKDLIINETNYTTFSITALPNVRPNNYSVMVIVNSTNASTIISTAPITFVPTSIFDQLMLDHPILRTFSNPVLQTLIFVTILGGLFSAGITWYINNRAKDKETYNNSLEALKDTVFMYYLPMAGYAKRFANKLERAYDNKKDLKYSFYLLAVFFSLRSTFQREKGGVMKLQSYKDERLYQKIHDEAMESIFEITGLDEIKISKIQKYVPHNTHFVDFELKLNQDVELMNIYNNFHNWINIPEHDKKIKSIIKSFRCYGEYMEYQTTLMFSAWYKREGLEKIIFWEPKATLSDDCKAYIETLWECN
jgi:hypothetical protein